MEANHLGIEQMAKKLDMSKARLRACCLKEGSPGKRSLFELSKVLEKTEEELKLLKISNKLEIMGE